MSSVVEAFEDCARVFPQRPALLCLGKSLEVVSYRKLYSVARACAELHFRSEQLIMVSIAEGKDLVGIELAAWMAGAFVCPFNIQSDPRAASIVSRLQPDFVITSNEDDKSYEFSVLKAHVFLNWNEEERDVVSRTVDSDSLSHIIFTSGTSSGEPKCVGVSHRTLIAFAKAKQVRSKIDYQSRLFLASTFIFDPQIGDVVCALSCGACLVLPQRSSLLSRFGELLEESMSTHVCTTPAMLQLIADNVPTTYLQEVLVGGEKMSSSLVTRLLRFPSVKIVNTYGVTECCIYQTTMHVLRAGDEEFLGEAYDGIEVDVFDFEENKPCAIDEEGEIVLLGRFCGYLAQAEKRPRVFSTSLGGFNQSVYRTGDVGVKNFEKNIRFFGRRDFQCKINGIRVDAVDVESVLAECSILTACAVIFSPLYGKLVAFCRCQDAIEYGIVPGPIHQLLHYFLKLRLPLAFIPSVFVHVENIPLSATGKVDKRSLLNNFQSREINDIHDVEILPSTFEEFIQQLWGQILGIPWKSISSFDSFQSLGGDSLLALKTVNRILTSLRSQKVESSVISLAEQEAQAFGEIQGPFSATALLQAKSLRDYTLSLQVHGEVKIQEERNQDNFDPDPAISRAMLDVCRLGLVHALKFLLDAGFSPDGRYVHRKFFCRTPLHECAQYGNLECLQLLIARGARSVAVTESRISSLHLAAACKNAQLCITSLLKAIRSERNDVIPLLFQDDNKQSALHYAARHGNSEAIEVLLCEELDEGVRGKALNHLDCWRRTALHWAVINAHVETVRMLLKFGAQVQSSRVRVGQPGPYSHLIQETVLQSAERRNAPSEIILMLTEAEKSWTAH